MKLIFEKKNLFEAIMKVQRTVSNKTTLPILECILIKAEDKNISLISSDGELFIKRDVLGVIEEEGSIAIESKTLTEIIRKMPEDEDIILEVDSNKNCIIKSEKAEFKVFGKDEKQFPPFPTYDEENKITMNEFTFKNVINQTSFSVASSEFEKVLTGECFEIEKNILKVISTDLYRISIRKILLDKEMKSGKYIIPSKALNEISRIIEGEVSNNINIYLSNNNAGFVFKNTIIVTPLLQGEFFDLKRIITEEYSTKITVNKKSFYDTIDRCMIFSNERKPVIIEIKDNNMNVKLESLAGEYKEDIEINKTGNDLMIGFTTKFLLDTLKVIDEENLNLYFTTSNAPVYITDRIDKGSIEDYSYMYLVIPLNLATK